MQALIRRRFVLESDAYFERRFNGLLLIRGQHLSETRYLLEEIQYPVKISKILERKAMAEFLSVMFLETFQKSSFSDNNCMNSSYIINYFSSTKFLLAHNKKVSDT